MSQFTIYRSTDGSAPTLSGTAGDLVNLLDKCLVAGYGSQAAAGWTKPYTGTNKAAFKAGAGNGFYLRVQDDAPGAGGAKEARIRGYETMSDVDTGTNLIPTAAQASTGLFVRKSASADGVARDWIIVADDRTFYGFIKSEVAVGADGVFFDFGFGDFYSTVTSDGYRTFIIGRATENSNAATANNLMLLCEFSNSGNATGHYVARNYLGTGSSIAVQKKGDVWAASPSAGLYSGGLGVIPFPNPCDGLIYLGPIWITDVGTSPVNHCRGRMRGLWQWGHPVASLTNGDNFSGAGELAGKTFLIISQVQTSTGLASVATIETSNTLDTN